MFVLCNHGMVWAGRDLRISNSSPCCGQGCHPRCQALSPLPGAVSQVPEELGSGGLNQSRVLHSVIHGISHGRSCNLPLPPLLL